MRICLAFLWLNICLKDLVCGTLVNVALNKHAIQDGVLNYHGFWDVSHSTDGRTNCPSDDDTHMSQYYSGTTDVHIEPWWQLDLGSVYEIQAIHVIGRPVTKIQLMGFTLSTGRQADALSIIYRNYESLYNHGDIWINITISAQVIKIQLPDDRQLTGRGYGVGPLILCEVEVYVYDIKSSSTVSMSSVYQTNDGYYGPRRAIDGVYPSDRYNTSEACHCCSLTAGTENPWWSIDFGNKLLIKGLTITGRPGFNSVQSKNVSIFISNTDPHGNNSYDELVWNISDNTHGSNFSHTFDTPRLFQYMTIARLHPTGHQQKYMTICEVDFTQTVCPLGTFGDRCGRECHCRDGKPCDPVTGHCQTPGCTDGRAGDACECDTGHYSYNCNETCGHCISNNTCLATDGTCAGGCAPGYYHSDKTCKTGCQRGHYGYNCNETCGHCIDGSTTCSIVDGACQHGCDQGYKASDPTCKTECDLGHYGYNCSETCGHCIDGNTMCSPVDGTCPLGCIQGYKASDPICKTECDTGHYSYNCNETCGHCIDNDECLATDGTCIGGCASGYYNADNTCKTECQQGHYGHNCNTTCGHCIDGNTTCSYIDGTCPRGCDKGCKGSDPTCKTECDTGHYSYNCNETCGHCINNNTCLATDGTCIGGCAPGYYHSDKTCKTGCQRGHYGYNCNETCGHCIDGSTTCSIVDGACQHGCDQGYKASDPTCKTECELGHYGYNCNETCGHCFDDNTTCSHSDGTCPLGCNQGYKASDPICKTECDTGHYSYNCNETCGHCIKNDECLTTDGTCTGGCSLGYHHSDQTCKTECQKGHYGHNCNETCGHCFDGNTMCSHIDGTCTRGCEPGYKALDPTCKTECDTGHYSYNCTQTCGHCIKNDTCLATDGMCAVGCAPGYYHSDKTCKTECDSGHYGFNCNETCGHCLNNDVCLVTDGTCIYGCTPGYYHSDRTCKTECIKGHYGHNCHKTCGHCIDGNTTCSIIDGTCTRGCDPGYKASDRTCKTVLNILQLKDFTITTRQSSQYGDRDSTKAVDGNRGPDVERCDCCAQTHNAEISWWQVDIGFVVAIKEIVIYGRQEESKYLQLSGFSVYLSTTAAFPTIPYDTEAWSISNMTYRIHVDGRSVRYIRIQRPGILTICEVEVFHAESGCPLNTYTSSCLPCGHCKDGAPCDSVTGRCPDGCDPSFSGGICTISPAASSNTSLIAGAVGGTVVVLVLVGVVVSLCRFFRNRPTCQLPGKSSSDYETPKPTITTEHNLYDTLDIVDADAYRGSSHSYENTAI